MNSNIQRMVVWVSLLATGMIIGFILAPQQSMETVPVSQIQTSDRLVKADMNETNKSQSGQASPVGMTADFEERLLAKLGERIHVSVAHAFAQHQSMVPGKSMSSKDSESTTSLSESQRQQLENLRTRLRNPSLNRSLTWQQLIQSPELAQLPPAIRNEILSEAAERLTRGELSADHFIGTPSN